MISIREFASECLAVNKDRFTIGTDVLGYAHGIPNRRISLLDRIKPMRETAFNLSAILVGHEAGYSGLITRAMAERACHAIDVMREIYAQHNIGIKRIYWSNIPEYLVRERGHVDINSSDEARELTDWWSADNNGIDVFFVSQVEGAAGWSAGENHAGSCDKEATSSWTGAVVELNGRDDFTGVALGHEVGHFLDLNHAGDIANMMGIELRENIGTIDASSRDITVAQANIMKRHCMFLSPCNH